MVHALGTTYHLCRISFTLGAAAGTSETISPKARAVRYQSRPGRWRSRIAFERTDASQALSLNVHHA